MYDLLGLKELIRRLAVLIKRLLNGTVCIEQLGVLISLVGFSGQETRSTGCFFIGFSFVLLDVELRAWTVHDITPFGL